MGRDHFSNRYTKIGDKMNPGFPGSSNMGEVFYGPLPTLRAFTLQEVRCII